MKTSQHKAFLSPTKSIVAVIRLLAVTTGQIATARTSRTVSDTTKPVVTLIGSSTQTITQAISGLYSDSGATWKDNIDGSGIISKATLGSVDITKTGTYTLQYTKTDRAGNKGTALRTISVVAPTVIAPVTTSPVVTSPGVALTWGKSDWANGGMFKNAWAPSQVVFGANNLASFTLNTVSGALVSGEYGTSEFVKYGTFETSMKASNVPGTINAFFTYTGPWETIPTQHDEIDFEIKGDNTNKVQLNYWTNDVEHPVTIDLGFDASQAFHTYKFVWTASSISWYIDGKLVHTENGSNGPLPTTASKIIINHWATINTGTRSTNFIDTNAPSTMQVNLSGVKYTAQ